MEEQGFNKKQLSQLGTVISTAISDSEERMKDFTRAEIRASEHRVIKQMREEVKEVVESSEKRVLSTLNSVLEQNIMPTIEEHDHRLKRLELAPSP